jgi:hypothetical protein
MPLASYAQPTLLERLPKPVFCIPLVLQWLWLGLRYRSLTLPSVVNPVIETGGLAGESKIACLAVIGAEHQAWVAKTVAVASADDADALRRSAGVEFPLIAKPDIGWCGYGVQRVADPRSLARYRAAFPPNAIFLLQAFVPGPDEAGLFYVRQAGDRNGRLVSITVRHQPRVTGDGRRTLAQLIAAEPRLSRQKRYRSPHFSAGRLAQVPLDGQAVLLSTVASLRVGGRYENAMRLHSPALEARIDAIARSMHGFNFGRFDVRFTSEAALRDGVFQIIEVNGAGSEAIQFWDTSYRLLDAYKGVFAKQRALFSLAANMRCSGSRPVGVIALARRWLAQQRLIRGYPASN